MSFGRKAPANANALPKRSERPRAVSARQVVGTPATRPKRNRMFGSGLFFAAAAIIGGGGLWADRSMAYYYEEGIAVAAQVTDSRKVRRSGSSRVNTKLTLNAQHPQFGKVELELVKPENLAPLPSGAPASAERVTVLLHPHDPEAGRIASADGPTSPLLITTIMALVFAAIAALNLVSEHRIVGSRKTRLRRD